MDIHQVTRLQLHVHTGRPQVILLAVHAHMDILQVILLAIDAHMEKPQVIATAHIKKQVSMIINENKLTNKLILPLSIVESGSIIYKK